MKEHYDKTRQSEFLKIFPKKILRNENYIFSKLYSEQATFCPMCGNYVEGYENDNYCCECGQALDWS